MDVPVGNIPFHCDEAASVKRRIIQLLPGILLLALGSVPLVAQVSIPYQFQSGAPARASEVNENFEALRAALATALTRINDLEAALARVDQLENEVQVLSSDLQAVKDSHVFAMDDYVAVMADPYVPGGTTIRFSGVNLQIVNGIGNTESINGLGNLIVGYNEADRVGDMVLTDKSGSHNIVSGWENSYASFGGLVVGRRNIISNAYASVSGGIDNRATGYASSVSGGSDNWATNFTSSVSGGFGNFATGHSSSVTGGELNLASGFASSVHGGRTNYARGGNTSILGGSHITLDSGIHPPAP